MAQVYRKGCRTADRYGVLQLDGGGFHAFPDPKAVAAVLGRALKPGANVTVARNGVRRISDFMIERFMKPRGYFNHALAADAYRIFLEQAGFNAMDVKMAGATALIRGVRA